MIWQIIYNIISINDNFLFKYIIIDIAGLKLAPETDPPQYIKALKVIPTGIASPELNMTDNKINVPINSIKYFNIYIYIIFFFSKKPKIKY